MLRFFESKPLLSEDDRAFQHACFTWLLKHFGGDHFYQGTQLVLPTKEFFPTRVDSPELAARETFEQVKKYAGMEQWPCRLVAQDEDPNPIVAPTVVVQNVEQNPAGTFSAGDSNEITITYNPKLTTYPEGMVATFAHELSHYLTSTAPEPPPGGWDNWEFATDICATFLGFGIFTANSAVNYRQYSTVDSQGWETYRSGYLSEAEYSYALALFLSLKGLAYSEALEFCDTNIRGYLKQAGKELDDDPIISQLHKVAYQPVHSE